MPRSINSGTITFGLVSIPVKFYTAASSESVSFNMLTSAGNRVKQKLVDSVTGAEIEHKDCKKGYEYAKDQYVSFTADELKALECEKSDAIDIREFVDASTLDLIQVEKSYYLGPDKGGDKGYTLLADTMKAMGKVAVAQWAGRGKEQLVVIRPHKGGLIIHQMYYANEVRNFEEIEFAKITIADAEREIAAKLVSMLSTGAFEPDKYEDGYVNRVKEAVTRKINGVAAPEVTAAPTPKATVTDLLAVLKASVDAAKNDDGKKPPTTKKKK